MSDLHCAAGLRIICGSFEFQPSDDDIRLVLLGVLNPLKQLIFQVLPKPVTQGYLIGGIIKAAQIVARCAKGITVPDLKATGSNRQYTGHLFICIIV